ncbi:MAG: DsrE family protein [Thermoplasmata archaeon]
MLVIITKPPYGLEDAFAGLRFALSTVSNGMPTTVIMLDDGVFNAIKGQKSSAISMPSNEDAISDLAGLEVPILVARESFEKRNLSYEKLNGFCKMINENELKEVVKNHRFIATF